MVAAFGSTTVGVLALVFAAKNTKRTLDQQREEADRSRRATSDEEERKRQHEWRKARDQRHWDRRNDTYGALLGWVGEAANPIPDLQLRAVAPDAFGADADLENRDSLGPRRIPRCKSVPGEIQAAVRLFASDAVVALVSEMQELSIEEDRLISYERMGWGDFKLEDRLPAVPLENLFKPENVKERQEARRKLYRKDIESARKRWNQVREALLATIRDEYPDIGNTSDRQESSASTLGGATTRVPSARPTGDRKPDSEVSPASETRSD
jgi:hypothetical protein